MSASRRRALGRAADPSFQMPGGTVLVTGAARGMGLLHAHRAASDGAATVVLWGRSAEGLQAAVTDANGKQSLVVRFASGDSQVLASQP